MSDTKETRGTLTEEELRAEFEYQHKGRNLKQHRLRGTYISAPIAALWNQHKRTAIWMQSRAMVAAASVAVSASDMGQDSIEPDCPHDTCDSKACQCAAPQCHVPAPVMAELRAIERWISKELPIPTTGATAMLIRMGQALDALASPRATDAIHPDTVRLDWLDEQNGKKNEQHGTRYGWGYTVNCNRIALEDHHWPVLTVREAIDAARRAIKEGV